MKKITILFTVFAFIMTFGMTSCKKCVTCDSCTGPGAATYEGNELCEKDFAGSKLLYDAAVAIAEDATLGGGCSCN